MNKSLLFLLWTPLLFSCVTQRDISGTYKSNIASLGFFSTRIKFSPDSTLEYRHSGDLIYDTAVGRYYTRGRKIYVKFEPIKLVEYFGVSNVPVLRTQRDLSLPFSYDYIYLIGRKKIFLTHIDTGKKVTKTWGYSKRKHYISFGSHYYNRRGYLKKVE